LGQFDLVERLSAVGPGAQVVAVPFPESGSQLGQAGVQQAEIIQGTVVFVVLGGDAVDAGLDAQVDVLGNQHEGVGRLLFAQGEDGVDDLVVRQAPAVAGG